MEADPGTRCIAVIWDCMIYEEASEVEEVVAMSATGIECWPLPFLELKFEPARDQACPAPRLQGFRLLLKYRALARYHRSELNDGLVISDATPPQPSSSPPLPPDTMASPAICGPQSPRSWGKTIPCSLPTPGAFRKSYFSLFYAHNCSPPTPKPLCWSY